MGWFVVLFVTPLAVYMTATMGPEPIVAGSFALLVLTGAFVALTPRVDFRIRGSLQVLALLVLGAVLARYSGTTPGTVLCSTVGCILALLLLGGRAGLVALAVSATAFLMLGATGRFETTAIRVAELPRLATWFRMTATYTVATGLLMVLVWGALRRVEASLAETKAALTEAIRERGARAEAERALRDSEERWRRISEASFEGIGVSENGVVTDANWQLAEMLGYSLAELQGRPVADLVAPADRLLVVEKGRLEDTGTYEHRAVRKDGSDFPVEVRGRSMTVEGRAVRMVAIRDIEERARLEADLRRSAREWQESFDAIGAGIVIVDHNRTLRRLNRAALAALPGSGGLDVTGRSLRDVSPSEPWPALADLAAGRGGDSAPASREIRDPATGRSWLLGASPLPREPGEPAWTILNFRNVTETVRLKDELQRRAKLAAIGSLVAGVAHEVRTPLFSISATLDAYDGSLASPEDRQEFFHLLRAQVERLRNLMTDLLEYGKPSDLQMTRGGLPPIIRGALRSCTSLAEKAGVALALDLPPALPAIDRDPGRLEQVFQNLLSNAVHHSRRGAVVRIAAQETEGEVVCTVEDQGQGLRPDELGKVFEPFFTRRKGGTGLGLAIVQRIVEEHGGHVTAWNRPEGGAIFTVSLPAAVANTFDPVS
jgi:PAS domain S-box-containing protein